MEKYFKYKRFNDFSIWDLKNDAASFGTYSLFKDQNELNVSLNCDDLKMQHDDSLDEELIKKVLIDHLNYYYLQFSVSKCPEKYYNNYNNIMKKMYKDYCECDGFIEVYEGNFGEKVNQYINNKSKHFIKVEYEKEPYNLANLIDTMLECINNEGIDEVRVQELLNERAIDIQLIQFMARKTNYRKEYENEYRIFIRKDNNIPKEKEHVSVSFVKPTKILIPKSLKKKNKNELIQICEDKEIEYEFIDFL